jgi:shikimate dehydrogenase
MGRPPGTQWPSAATRIVGVIGDPVAHSLTPLLHNAAFGSLGLDWLCVGFTVHAGGASGALAGMRALGLSGLSVTMPHKSDVFGLVDQRTEVAQRLGAVNSVHWRGEDLIGDNTDGAGFLAALERGTGFDPANKRCLVLGAGGAARAVLDALASAGAAEVAVVNRTVDHAFAAAALVGPRGRVSSGEDAEQMDLVVNATPCGMLDSAAVDAPPLIDPRHLGAGQVVADLVYHPLVTPWLRAAAANGAQTVGGLGMLVHQAAVALESWTGRSIPVAAMWDAANGALGGGALGGGALGGGAAA